MPVRYGVVAALLVPFLALACGGSPEVPPAQPTATAAQGAARLVVQTIVAQTAAARGVAVQPIVASPTIPPTEAPSPTIVKLPTPLPSATATPTGPTVTPTPAPTKEPVLEARSVVSIGNLLPEPSLAATPLGPICVGDSVNVLETRQQPDGMWYRVQVTKLAADCDPKRVKVGARGWLSDLVLLPLQ